MSRSRRSAQSLLAGLPSGRAAERANRARPAGGRVPARAVRPPADQARREFVRDVTADLRYWYSTAESKAQLVLTVNGLFLTFLTTGVLASRDAAARATAVFGPETWTLLAAMSLCLALAILNAVACLASRGLGTRKLRRQLDLHHVDPGRASTYPPELAAFFYYLSALHPGQFAQRVMTADPDFFIQALASDIVEFAPYILAKHRWVNRAFALTGLTLGFFLSTGI